MILKKLSIGKGPLKGPCYVRLKTPAISGNKHETLLISKES
jgi:hypothetical protein